MKSLFGLFLALAVTLILWSGVQGGQDKEITIKGRDLCQMRPQSSGTDHARRWWLKRKTARISSTISTRIRHKKFHGTFVRNQKTAP